jgi:hypothetical protein
MTNLKGFEMAKSDSIKISKGITDPVEMGVFSYLAAASNDVVETSHIRLT